MQLNIFKEKPSFIPITLQITIEDQLELEIWTNLFGSMVTIPKLIADRYEFSVPAVNIRMKMSRMLAQIYSELTD